MSRPYNPIEDLKDQLGSALDEIKRLHQGLEKIVDDYATSNKTPQVLIKEVEALIPARRRKNPNQPTLF